MGRVREATPAQRRHAAAARRDDALARLSSITTGVGVAVIVAVGALGVYVARALPGHHSAPAGTSTSNGGASAPAPTGNFGSLTPPSAPPQGTSLPAPVTSAPS